MTKDLFLSSLKEQLELDTYLTLDTHLKELDEWDSMSGMLLMAFISDEFGKEITADDLKNMTDVNSLIDIVGPSHFV